LDARSFRRAFDRQADVWRRTIGHGHRLVVGLIEIGARALGEKVSDTRLPKLPRRSSPALPRTGTPANSPFWLKIGPPESPWRASTSEFNLFVAEGRFPILGPGGAVIMAPEVGAGKIATPAAKPVNC